MHEKSQRLFHNYVLSQREMRFQQQNIQYLLAVTNNDADLLLSLQTIFLNTLLNFFNFGIILFIIIS
jgi:hypothetical protein